MSPLSLIAQRSIPLETFGAGLRDIVPASFPAEQSFFNKRLSIGSYSLDKSQEGVETGNEPSIAYLCHDGAIDIQQYFLRRASEYSLSSR